MLPIKKRDFFTIPNILCYFRLLLIPVFVSLYLKAETPKEYFFSALIVGVSGLTDLLDGLIARKLNQVTELGKLLDPLADKLTQGALVFCLTSHYPAMWILVGLFIVKEGFMAVMGILMLKHNGRKLDGAQWFGKVSTAVLYITMFVLLLIPSLPVWLANALICLCAVTMLFTLASYIPVFHRMWHMDPIEKNKKDETS
ncbi:MAG: CDP-alcohol phosphatidyltransferase family protein [Clostridiales bacterium]|nr:CDP-alcohol phosphatidyltransferase family protein [Clostridiales bacterium]